MLSGNLRHYSLIHVLGGTSLVALIVWSGVPEGSMALQRLVVGLFVIATVTAIRSHADYPFRRSSIAAVAYFACTLLYWWAYRWALYFTDPPGPNEPPFFEDGMIVEGFIYPVIYLLVYIPVVVAFTLVLAAAIVAVTNILVNCKSPTASTPLARHNPSEH